MDTNNYVLSLVALTAWREERSEGLIGMTAVAFVIRNRVFAGWEGRDPFKVITAKNQFDGMVLKGDPNTVEYPDPRDPTFVKLLQSLDGIMDGTTPDTLTNGALYYADLNEPGYNKTGWFQTTIVDQPTLHPRTTTIGTTSYFK